MRIIQSGLVTLLLTLLCLRAAHGEVWQITEIPQGSADGFRHSLFHSASSESGEMGATLGYIGLDHDQFSFYDSGSGTLNVHAITYSDPQLQNRVANVTITSTSFDFKELSNDGFSNESIGSLLFTFDFGQPVGELWSELHAGGNTQQNSAAEIELSFLDARHTSGNLFANSAVLPTIDDPGYALLWGADGPITGTNFSSATLGVDLAFTLSFVHAPEPASLGLWLFGAGAGSPYGLQSRRRKRPVQI